MLRNWIHNVRLGIIIIIKIAFKRIFNKFYKRNNRNEKNKMDLNLIINDFENYKFFNEQSSSSKQHSIKIFSSKKNKIYASSIKQILLDHFKINSEIVIWDSEKIILKKNDLERKIELYAVKNYLTSNLNHNYNLCFGSDPVIVCKFIREIEEIVVYFGIFKPIKCMSIYWTVDCEAQLSYMDNKSLKATNIFSTRHKTSMILNKTVSNIINKLTIPVILFIPFELLDFSCTDAMGHKFSNVRKNIDVLTNLPKRASICFHGYFHDKYIKLLKEGKLTKTYLENEMEKYEEYSKTIGIKFMPVNRYPSLSREEFSLDVLNKHNFQIDMSDIIKENQIKDFSGFCRYRLLEIKGNTIRPCNVWEIPVIYADPYINIFNKTKIKKLLKILKQGSKYHKGEVALMFHDKIIGFPSDGDIIFSLLDGRINKTGNHDAIKYLINLISNEDNLKIETLI